MSEETYTLDEARTELARRKCLEWGHDYDIGERVEDGVREPIRFWCGRCSRAWALQPGTDAQER